MTLYILFCEKNFEYDETYYYFLPFTDENHDFIQSLYYLIFYADWNECEGHYSIFYMDMEYPKTDQTVDDMILSYFHFETHYPAFQKLEGVFSWPFSFSHFDVKQLTPIQMAYHLNEHLSNGGIQRCFTT